MNEEPVARIVRRFDPDDPAYRERTFTVELWGGLGDVFNHIHWCPCYGDLETLGPAERVYVLCSSHNAAAWELFGWHRRAAQMTVCSPGFFPHFTKPDWRVSVGLPADWGCTHNWPIKNPTRFYPPDRERPRVEAIQARGRYVVFALTGSQADKSVAREVGEDAAERALARGYHVVLTGRNYPFTEAHLPPRQVRDEVRLTSRPHLLDAIDAFTVPGTAELVRGAAGVFTCHSALCMLAWHVGRPTLTLMDDWSRRTYFPTAERPDTKYEGYSFGGGRPGNDYGAFREYTGEKFERWLDGLGTR